MHDLVIRNATIVDGTGSPGGNGDLAFDGAVISSVGGKAGPGRREINADGLLATPGWVDIHSHYDGQVFWDPYLTPSGWHGVTTLVMGNCGVGFAPVHPGQEEYLISLMESVEDIPGPTLRAGIKWGWESFPEYLDALSRTPTAVDIGTQVPHCALRVYVMGARGASNQPAREEDIARMGELALAGLGAGALGISTSRTITHRTKEGQPVPGTYAAPEELYGLGRALRAAGHGVFELASDVIDPDASWDWMVKLSTESGRPLSFAAVLGARSPKAARRLLEFVRHHNAAGAHLAPQIAGRPPSLLMGWQSTLHPFITHPSYQPLAQLSLPERLARLRDPALRARIVAERPAAQERGMVRLLTSFQNFFPLGDPPDYEPPREMSLAELARRQGITPPELAYDIMMQREGREFIYLPLIYQYSLEGFRELMLDPQIKMGLADGGAHCGLICDSSMPTYALTYWVRDRTRGERLGLELAVKRQTRDTAELYGLRDRGLLAPGMKADLNLIDFDALRIHAPEMRNDLPAHGRRLVQTVEGYRLTTVSGQIIFEDGQPTGALPGKLIRGPQAMRA